MTRNWKNILISPTTTMAKTIEVIDKGSLKLALVVDEDNRLCGVVTDGDIRRALIKHQSMSTSIDKVMNANPLVTKQGKSSISLLNIM